MFENLAISIVVLKFAIAKLTYLNTAMDIVSRLKLFLQQNGIANSQFADTCEIPRPTLSQLLNGRNKKVSDEIISKIHRAYPSLNVMWLMFGDGDMFVGGRQTGLSEFDNPMLSSSVMSGSSQRNADLSKSRQPINFGDDDGGVNDVTQNPSMGNLTDTLRNIAMSVGKKNTNQTVQSGARKVTNILVFYSDNSFESFTPA